MTKLPFSIGTGLQLQVDVRISDFVAWRAVSHDQKGCIIVGRIQEVMTIASACRECDAGAWPDRLASRIGDEDEFTLDDVDEFILFRVGVPSRRLAARLDTYEVDAVVFEPTVIAETPCAGRHEMAPDSRMNHSGKSVGLNTLDPLDICILLGSSPNGAIAGFLLPVISWA